MLGTQVLSGLSHPSDPLGSVPGGLGSRQGRRGTQRLPGLLRGSPGQRAGEGSKGAGTKQGGCVSEMMPGN